MATYSLDEFASVLMESAGLLTEGIERAEDEAQQVTFAFVIARSLGPLSYAELAKRGHPYARRHGTALVDPSIINFHTGEFMAGWYTYTQENLFGRSRIIANDSEHAKWILKPGGTDLMLERTPEESAAEEGTPLRSRGVDRAMRAALRW